MFNFVRVPVRTRPTILGQNQRFPLNKTRICQDEKMDIRPRFGLFDGANFARLLQKIGLPGNRKPQGTGQSPERGGGHLLPGTRMTTPRLAPFKPAMGRPTTT